VRSIEAASDELGGLMRRHSYGDVSNPCRRRICQEHNPSENEPSTAVLGELSEGLLCETNDKR